MIPRDPRAEALAKQVGPVGLGLRAVEYALTYTRLGRVLTDSPPPVVRATGRGYRVLTRTVVHGARSLGSSAFTDADPFALRWVDPNRIVRVERESPQTFGVVVGGEWDRSSDRFDDRPIPRSIRARLLEGRPWSETPYFERLCTDRGRASARRWGTSVDRLAERIESEGYLTQAVLFERDPERAIEANTEAVCPRLNEIGVSIARDGDLLWRHRGQHRLAVARALGIKTIPVLVLSRHERWQAFRDRIRESGRIPDRYEDHPDLRSISS